MKNKKEIEQQTRGWIPKKSTAYPIQNTHRINLISFFARTTIATLGSLAFIALIITAGFGLSTGLDYRWYVVFGALFFSVPFGVCMYKTYLSMAGFFAFGITLLLSILAGTSIVNTMMYSILACVAVAASLALVKTVRKRRGLK